MNITRKQIGGAILIVAFIAALVAMQLIGEQKVAERREAARVRQETARIQEEARNRQSEVDRQEAVAKINAKRDAELEESRRKSEESKRHLEETLAARQAQEEQYAAREKELAESRMSVDEFNARFLATFKTERMTEPTQRTKNGIVETVTYPFDHEGELFLTEISTFGAIKSILFDVKKIDSGNLDAAWFFYAAAVQIFTSPAELDYVFAQLKLYPADVAAADLKNSRSVKVGDYLFKKNAGSSSISFSIVDTR